MAKYHVYAIIDASKYIGQVEAATEEEAKEKAWEMEGIERPSLCHQCSREIDLGDICDMLVYNDDEKEA